MKLTKNIRKKQKKKKYEQSFSNLETFRLILKNTPFVVFCMLSSLTTIEQEQFHIGLMNVTNVGYQFGCRTLSSGLE